MLTLYICTLTTLNDCKCVKSMLILTLYTALLKIYTP